MDVMQLSLEDVQDIKVAEDLVLDESERSSLEALIKTFRIPDKRVKGIYSFTYKGLHKKEMLERLRFVWEIESVLASQPFDNTFNCASTNTR